MKELFLKINLNPILFRTLNSSKSIERLLYRMQLKTKTIIFVSLFSWFVLGNVSWAKGGAVGNGGGFSICSDGKYYSFDYLLTMDSSHQELSPNDNLLQYLQQIEKEMIRLEEPLAADFSLFIQSLFQQIPKSKYQWLERESLPLLWEPALETLLPSHCKKRVQTVVFFGEQSKFQPYTAYAYVPHIIEQVLQQKGGTIQVAYLLVHEWLWNFFPRENFQNLAWFNRILNSEAIKTLDQAEYRKIRNQFLKP